MQVHIDKYKYTYYQNSFTTCVLCEFSFLRVTDIYCEYKSTYFLFRFFWSCGTTLVLECAVFQAFRSHWDE